MENFIEKVIRNCIKKYFHNFMDKNFNLESFKKHAKLSTFLPHNLSECLFHIQNWQYFAFFTLIFIWL